MKKTLISLLTVCAIVLSGCGIGAGTSETGPTGQNVMSPTVEIPEEDVVEITLDGQNLTLGGAVPEEGSVFISRDIIYYENKTQYESGNPYGEGEAADMHTAEEATNHLVVNITQPGTYRLRGNLDLGQIRVDLGEEAKDDPGAVVNLILENFSVRCDVAPGILFLNVYECDAERTADNATPNVDTSAAGANLILAEGSENTVQGSHVAKIFKDKDGEKKLWKQDGAVYSYMSMNVFGSGRLDILADNEGMDTERHLTILDGDIRIRSGNDGINTNEDGVSVTTILGGSLHIIAGLGQEGDGIDSNGYLVIRGGRVISSAHPASDAGLDSDLGSFIHGGTVIALGSAMDWAESDSDQVTMNLQFSWNQTAGSTILITRENGEALFAYDPSQDEALGENAREFSGAVISCPAFAVGESCQVILGAEIQGKSQLGIFDAASVESFSGGAVQAYTGTDVMRGPGGFRPEEGHQRPEGDKPEDFTGPQGNMEPPEGMPEGFTMPQGGGEFPDDKGRRPDGQGPKDDNPRGEGQMPPEGFGNQQNSGQGNTIFFLQDKVNFFSGLSPALEQTMPIA